MKPFVEHGLLWLMAIVLLPIGLVLFLVGLMKAAMAGVVFAALALLVFLINYFNRNGPHAKMARSPLKSPTIPGPDPVEP